MHQQFYWRIGSGVYLKSYSMLMKARTADNRSITPEKAKKILLENNIEVDEKEVEEILEFLYFLAKLTVNQYVKDKETGDI